MQRRGFLGAILAACAAPAIVRSESLMKLAPSGLMVPDELKLWSFPEAQAFDDMLQSLDEMLEVVQQASDEIKLWTPKPYLKPGDIFTIAGCTMGGALTQFKVMEVSTGTINARTLNLGDPPKKREPGRRAIQPAISYGPQKRGQW